ncbi:MAG TPA: sigma-70 family RNA polymerase sigma factor [Thermoanaerobaculia bacterium]|nr:sigma-70 family RNA polymerase sigma factor [Thermoanaerobaculia bacterium]
MNDEEIDRTCVARCLGGDLDAFSMLIDRYQHPIFNAIFHMVKNYEDAQEVSQQVFMKVYQHLNSYDPNRKFFSWIYRVAMNEAINHMKSRREWEPLTEAVSSRAPGPAERFEAKERERTLRAAVMALDTNYRAVIVLRHFLELSYEEAAELLSLPVKTVKSRLFTARQLLREWLVAGEGA